MATPVSSKQRPPALNKQLINQNSASPSSSSFSRLAEKVKIAWNNFREEIDQPTRSPRARFYFEQSMENHWNRHFPR